MRRLSRLSAALTQTSFGRTGSQAPSNYVCQRCLRKSITRGAPVLAMPYSTMVERAGGFANSIGQTLGVVPKPKPEAKALEKEKKKPKVKYATTWEGLEWYGNSSWYEQQNKPTEDFESFGPIKMPLTAQDQIQVELLKAVVEVTVIANLDPTLLDGSFDRPWIETEYEWPNGIRVGSDPASGLPKIDFPNAEAENYILNKFIVEVEDGQEDVPLSDEHYSPTSGQVSWAATSTSESTTSSPFAESEDQGLGKWASISLHDLQVKFSLAKRVQQRTGIRLSDPQIAQVKTVGALFSQLWKPEPPKKLAERLKMNKQLADLPNVKIFNTRRTIVHKEKELGRWKVIEDELNARGIPATGAAL